LVRQGPFPATASPAQSSPFGEGWSRFCESASVVIYGQNFKKGLILILYSNFLL
jgi:hypothetical protein